MILLLKIDWAAVGAAILAFLNSSIGFGLVVIVIGFILRKIFAARPNWKQYKGTIISGIRWAEKTIPDDTGNSALAKTDAALKYVLAVFIEHEGRKPTDAEKHALDEGIRIEHDRMEREGKIHKPKKPKPESESESG